MSTLFIDGFEQFKNAKDPAAPDALKRAGYSIAGNSIVDIAGRLTGGTAMSLGNSQMFRILPWSDRFFSMGAAVFMFARNAVITLKQPNGLTLACAWLNSIDGMPYLNSKAGASSPSMKTWYYFEIVIDRQSQTMALWINNRAEVLNLALPASVLTATSLIATWGTQSPPGFPGMEPLPEVGGLTYYDDIYAHDADRLNPIAITTRFPTANHAVTWTPSPDAGTNWEIVSLRPPVPLDKNVVSDVVGNTDSYTSSTPLANINAIVATGVCVLARKSPSLQANLGVFIGNNPAAPRRDGSIAIDSNWTTRYQAFYQVIGDTKGGIEAAPFGILVAPP